jgi:protein-tyrosine phosphatase
VAILLDNANGIATSTLKVQEPIRVMTKYSILCVCTDNLCRSPVAAEVLRQKIIQQGLAGRVEVESAATHDFNVGEPADIRAQKHAMRRGYDIAKFIARLIEPADFDRFDLILAMDEGNLFALRMICPPQHLGKLHFFTACCDERVPQDVPDPFYGDSEDFEFMLEIVEVASDRWVQRGVRFQQPDAK